MNRPHRWRACFILASGCAIGAVVLIAGGQPVRQENANPAAVANNAFALDLYRQLAKDKTNAEQNLWFSPYSLTSALAMAAEGARENTLAQMTKVLRFGNSAQVIPLLPIHLDIAKLNLQLQTTAGGTSSTRDPLPPEDTPGLLVQPEPYQFAVANALWGDRQYPFEPRFVETLRKYYGAAGIFPVDFLHDAESARLKINAWTEEQTRQKIKDLVPQDAVNSSTRLVLTNAVYFKGAWVYPFKEGATTTQPFHVTKTKDVPVPLMRVSASGFLYMENDRLQLLSMPYVGSAGARDLAMIVVLPRQADGLTAIEQSMTDTKLAEWIATADLAPVQVFFPKFKMTTKLELSKELRSMGMSDPFDLTRANFGGISPRTKSEPLFISAVLHDAYVDVDENGTEAAAATALVMVGSDPRPQDPPPVFRADHPFLVMIRHNSSGAILFLGRVFNPASQPR